MKTVGRFRRGIAGILKPELRNIEVWVPYGPELGLLHRKLEAYGLRFPRFEDDLGLNRPVRSGLSPLDAGGKRTAQEIRACRIRLIDRSLETCMTKLRTPIVQYDVTAQPAVDIERNDVGPNDMNERSDLNI
jgi:hypothetical protein